jgi:hypothetical protein
MGYEPILAILVIVVAIIAPFLAAGGLMLYLTRAKRARGHEMVYDVLRSEKDYGMNEWWVRIEPRSGVPDPKPGDVVLLLEGVDIRRFKVRAVPPWNGRLVLRGSYLSD